MDILPYDDSEPRSVGEGSASTNSRPFLTCEEKAQICEMFERSRWHRNMQVLWSGIPREFAQRWANEREMQTLTTAMGNLMVSDHPNCLKLQKSSEQWSRYIKGASALFAQRISKGEVATVLLPPPPHTLHPSCCTSYQAIEEPIVKGMLRTGTVSRIEMVYLTVKGAENICY